MRKISSKNPAISFKGKVFGVVKNILKGRVMSYKEVAVSAGRPLAARAVGNILNKNMDPGIPCHRVVRSDGRVGGYNRGSKNKIALLKEEGLKIEKGRIV